MSLSWPFQDVFCFPLYYYPASLLVGWMIFYIILKILSCFQTVTQESAKTNKFVEQQKQQTIQHLNNLTPLPIDIVNVIVNQYLFDEKDKKTFWKMLNKKLEFRSKITLAFMAIYAIIGVLLYILCFFIIILQHIEWREQNKDDLSSWESFQGWLVSILLVHPFWKIVNWTTSIWTIYDGHDIRIFAVHTWVDHSWRLKKWLFYVYGIPYGLIFVSYIIPAIFPIILPALVVFFPILLCYCVLFCGVAWLLHCLSIHDKLYEGKDYSNQELFELLLFGSLSTISFYVVMGIVIPSIWCFYDGGDWFECFVYGATSGYCPHITIDFTNWKSVVLLITWVAF